MNTTAMCRAYQEWCAGVTGQEQEFPLAGPIWECWAAAWRESYKVRHALRPMSQRKMQDLAYTTELRKQDMVYFGRLVELHHNITGDDDGD